MVKINAMRVRFALAALVNSVPMKVRANIAAVARRINLGILLTNHTLPSIHSELVPKSRLKDSTCSFAEKKKS